MADAQSFADLVRLTAKRSVYSMVELDQFQASPSHPVKVIDFLLIGHLDSPMGLQELVREGVFNGRPPQSICHLSDRRFDPVRKRMNFGFDA
jgi:hypothetical protein